MPPRPPEIETEKDASDQACPLCGRPLVPGPSVDRHHLVPKSRGGAKGAVVLLHKICHRKIHATLTEAEIARSYPTIEALRARPEIARFLTWIEKRPPEFTDHHRSGRRRR